MDAAQKTHHNTHLFLLIALAFVLAAPGWSQTPPAFTLSQSTVNLNQSVTGVQVSVGSSGDPITFTPSITYGAGAAGGTGIWLKVTSDTPNTPANLQIGVNSVAGLPAGTFTASVILTPSAPAGVNPATISVSFANGSGGGGGGGGSTITVSQTTVTLSANQPNSAFANVTVSTSSASTIGVSASATTNSGGSWLSASLNNTSINSGSSSTLTIQANSAFLANGTYQGTVTLTPSTGGAATIGVNFTVGGSGGSGTLNVTPNPVNLSYTSGGAFPFQFVSLSSTSGASTYTATVISTNTGWLSINNAGSIASGTIAGGVTISAGSAVTSLPNGVSTGTVQVTDNLGGTNTITVNVTVNGGSTTGLTVTPNSLSFTSALGGGSQFNNLTVTSTVGGAFTTSTNASWLGATVTTGSPIQANTAGTVQVVVIPGSLASGTYNGSVTITVTPIGGVGQAQSIPVTLVVGTGGGGGGGGTTTGVAPTSLSVTYQTGTPAAFVQYPVLAITGTSGAWSSSIAYGQGTGWLQLSPSSGSSLPAQSTVRADGTGLGVGNYTATITITTPGGNQTVTFNLAVTSGPVLIPSPGGLVFNYQSGTSLPQGQTINLSPSDFSVQFELAGAVTTTVPWLTVSTIQTGQRVFSVTADPTGLTGGVYVGAVNIAATSLPSVTIPVVLVINGGAGGGGGGGGSGPLSFSTTSLSFSAAVGANPASQNLTVTANAQTNFTVSANQTWLAVSQTSGTVPPNNNLTVTVNSAGLPSGNYNGVLTFNSNGTIQTVSVNLTVGSGGGSGGNITLSPSSLNFTGQPGGTIAAQAIQITSTSGAGVSFNVSPTTTSGGNWLTVSPTFGTATGTAQTLTVNVSTSGLTAGTTYQGNLQITPAGGTVVNVPVTFTLSSPSVTVPATTLTFSYRAGSANPAAQQLAVSGSGATLNFTATASSNGNWLSVTPSSGTTPATLNVSINGTGLAAGSYSGSITVAGTNGATGSTTIPVALTVTVPLPTITRLGNAGSYASASIAPGEIITLFGTDLGPATPAGLTLDSSGRVATTLSGVQVTVNGFLSPMVFVSDKQVSAVVPYELAQFSSANVLVKFLGQSSNGVAVNVTTTAPGLFTQNASGTGPGAILNQDNSTNGPANAATRGQTVVVYLTGEGQTNPAGVTGKVTTVSSTPPLTPSPLLLPSILIGGQGANYTFAGEAPGIVSGVLQLNVTIPTTVGTGELPIVVSIGGNPSQAGVTVSVK